MSESQKDFQEQFETVGELSNGYAIKELNISDKTKTYKLYESLYSLLTEYPECLTLAGKTQVLDIGVSDPELGITTRMMHDMHVSQNAMKIALKLYGKDLEPEKLEEVMLAKIIGLAHDLGHTPFGHNGEVGLRKALTQVGKEYTFSHEVYSSNIIRELINRFNEWAFNLPGEMGGLKIPEEMIDYIATGAKNHTIYYDYLSENEGIPQKSARLADSLSFMVTDLYDLIAAGITNKDELLEKLDKNGVEVNEDALETIFGCLTTGGDGLRELHEILISEAFKENRRGTYDLKTSVIDDYKLLQEITDTYVSENEMTNKKRAESVLAIAKYAEYLANSKNSVPNIDFWKAMMTIKGNDGFGNVNRLMRITENIKTHADNKTVEFSQEDIEYIDAVISRTKDSIQKAKIFIQNEELSNCPTLMTLFIMQDEIQYKEILRKAPERLGNDYKKDEALVIKAFHDVLKLAYAASRKESNEYLIQGRTPNLSTHNGNKIPEFNISRDGKQTEYEPLRYAVYCVQQMQNADLEGNKDYFKAIVAELGLSQEKVEEILKINIDHIFIECRRTDDLLTRRTLKGFFSGAAKRTYIATNRNMKKMQYTPGAVLEMAIDDEDMNFETYGKINEMTKAMATNEFNMLQENEYGEG